MCLGGLFTRDRSRLPNPDLEVPIADRAVETQVPVFSQPTRNGTIQAHQIVEDLPVAKTSSVIVEHNFTAGEIPPADFTMPPQSSQGTLDTPALWGKWKKDLRDKLKKARVACGMSKNFFWPKSALDELITTSVIEQEIIHEYPNMPLAERNSYVERIFKHAKKMFAIYATLNADGASVRCLVETNLCDKDLPLERQGGTNGWWLARRSNRERIVAFDKWDYDAVEEFDRIQWWTLAIHFDQNNLKCLELDDEAVLPYISTPRPVERGDEEVVDVGGFSEVAPYQIHHEFNNFRGLHKFVPSESYPRIAVKRLYHQNRIEFLKERTILQALAPKNHPHLIQLLANYRFNKHYHFIFPWADANLRVYWKNNPTPGSSREEYFWTLKQISGIVDGVSQIHSFEVKKLLEVEPSLFTPRSGTTLRLAPGEEKYGRHGDIKAENILWFKKEGVLKISDFGLGRFHGIGSAYGIDHRHVIHGETYAPPERTIGKDVSRNYDIWSLACLILEFLTWQLKGDQSIVEFSDKRGEPGLITLVNDDNFFTASGNTAEVRKSVLRWVDDLHLHEKCSMMVHDLLDLTMDHMLRVDTSEREKAVNLSERMKEIVAKAEGDDQYLIGPNPRSQTTSAPT